MIPFFSPQMTGFEGGMLDQVIASNYLNDGPRVKEFEQTLADRIGVEHVICTTSGTAALFLAITAYKGLLDAGQRLNVHVPSVTFIATANAATLAGSSVHLFNEEPKVFRPIRSYSPAYVDLVVPVHVSGHQADTDFPVDFIEDCCESFPSKPEVVGGMGGCYSFSPNKLITTGQGGCVATNDDRLAHDIRALKDQGRAQQGTGGDDEHPTIGFNFKMTDLQAAVGLAQLTDLDRRIERRREIQRMYEEALPVIPFRPEEVPLWTDMEHPDREGIIARVESAGYQCRRFWKPLSQQPPYLDPTMKTDTSKMFWLPSSFQLTNEDVNKVIGAVGG